MPLHASLDTSGDMTCSIVAYMQYLHFGVPQLFLPVGGFVGVPQMFLPVGVSIGVLVFLPVGVSRNREVGFDSLIK